MRFFSTISTAIIILTSLTCCQFKAKGTYKNNDINKELPCSEDKNNDEKENEIKTDYENIYKTFTDTLSNNYRVLHKEFNQNIHKIYYISHNQYRDKCTPIYVLDVDKQTTKEIISNDYFQPKNYNNEVILVSVDNNKTIDNHLYIVGNREACGSGWIIEHPIVYIDMNTYIVYGFDECAAYKFLKDNKIRMTKAIPTNLDSATCSAEYTYDTWEETKTLK